MAKSKSSEKSSVPMPAPAASSSAPEIRSFNRIASIPILAYCIQTVSGTLSNNRYTSLPYSTAKDLSASAYKVSEPFQVQLRPLIESFDGLANKAIDSVEYRFPGPFKAKPEDVSGYVRDRRQNASDYIAEYNKTLDEKVKTPAVAVVYGMDQRLTPIVDYLEQTATTRLNAAAPGETQFQVQRVYVLSKNVTGQLYDDSKQTIIAQRAFQTADTITTLAAAGQSRIHELSDSLLADIQRLQGSVLTSGTKVSQEVNDTVTSLRMIITTPNLTLNEKVMRVGAEVDWRIRPLLKRILGVAQRTAPTTNGNGNGHAQ